MAGLLNSMGVDNGFTNWWNERRNAIGGLGLGLASGNTLSEGIALGTQGALQGRQADDAYAIQEQERARREQEIASTSKWLQENYPEFADLPPDQGFALATKMMSEQKDQTTASQRDYLFAKSNGFEGSFADWVGGGAAEAPATVREWEYFSSLPQDQQAEYLRMKRSNPYLDVGTGFVSPDPLNPGQTAGAPIVKDNFTPAYDSAAGTGQGKVDVETRAAADSLASKLPGLQSVIGELNQLAKTATYTQTGQLIDNTMREAGMEPSDAAIARTKYIAIVDNQVLPLLRDTFGAAFTVKEGETLRATLGDPNKSPSEKQATLEAFIEQKKRDLAALQSRLPGATMPGMGTGTTSTGLQWSVEP